MNYDIPTLYRKGFRPIRDDKAAHVEPMKSEPAPNPIPQPRRAVPAALVPSALVLGALAIVVVAISVASA